MPQGAPIISFSLMSMLILILLALANLSLAAWVYLFLGRGFFWRTDQRLTDAPGLGRNSGGLPSVAVLVPARNEADILPLTLPQLLLQDYRDRFHVWLVDDSSDDGTAEAARRVARDLGMQERLSLVTADPLMPGWTGKLWALNQGVQAASLAQPEYLLFVDADIVLAPGVLRTMVEKAVGDDLHLVSVMALLKLLTSWERLLIPAFVYFFMLLYPFRWVNNPRSPVAAAAGGCLLVRRATLESAGGLRAIAGELIDDCSLAKLIKSRLGPSGKPDGRATSGKIWLGLSCEVVSVRPYGGLKGVWTTVSRTAFTQVDHSAILLAATVLGMLLGFWPPPCRWHRRLVSVGLWRRHCCRSVAVGCWGSRAGLDERMLSSHAAVVPGLSHAGLAAARYSRRLHIDDHRLGVAVLARPGWWLERAHLPAD